MVRYRRAAGATPGRAGAETFVNALPHPEPVLPRLSAGPLTPRAVWQSTPLPPDFSEAPEFDFRVQQGMFVRHLRRVRRVYRQRHERIAAALAAAAPDPPGVVFGYGMIDARRIDEGLARPHRCLDSGR